MLMQKNNNQNNTPEAMCVNQSELSHKWHHNLKYLLVGMFFGILFIKAEVVSWFRIQEMFRLQCLHKFGIIGSAVLVGMISVFIINNYNVKTIDGKHIK